MPKRKPLHRPFVPFEAGDREKRAESPVSWWLHVTREDWKDTVEAEADRLARSPMGQRGGTKESC